MVTVRNVREPYTFVLLIHFDRNVGELTLRSKQPFSKPSSMALILLDDRSKVRRFLRGFSSAVEKIGFKLSPSRLCERRSTVNDSLKPLKDFSGKRRIKLCDRSNSSTGSFKVPKCYSFRERRAKEFVYLNRSRSYSKVVAEFKSFTCEGNTCCPL